MVATAVSLSGSKKASVTVSSRNGEMFSSPLDGITFHEIIIRSL